MFGSTSEHGSQLPPTPSGSTLDAQLANFTLSPTPKESSPSKDFLSILNGMSAAQVESLNFADGLEVTELIRFELEMIRNGRVQNPAAAIELIKPFEAELSRFESALDTKSTAFRRLLNADRQAAAAILKAEFDKGVIYPRYLESGSLERGRIDRFLDLVIGCKDSSAELKAWPDHYLMFRYQPTTIGIILHMIQHAAVTEEDTFIDLGCGSGRLPVLVSLLSGAKSIGVEINPELAAKAYELAKNNSTAQVSIVQSDVREADLRAGTVFYLFNPFAGSVLSDVLDKLKVVSQDHPITVCSLSQSNFVLINQPWLERQRAVEPEERSPTEMDGGLQIFKSK